MFEILEHLLYGKCSEISNAFLFLFLNELLVFRAVIHKLLAKIANREDPDQQSDLGLPGLSRLFNRQHVFIILEL